MAIDDDLKKEIIDYLASCLNEIPAEELKEIQREFSGKRSLEFYHGLLCGIQLLSEQNLKKSPEEFLWYMGDLSVFVAKYIQEKKNTGLFEFKINQ